MTYAESGNGIIDERYTDAVESYFRAKAPSYDRVDEQPYWRLSDDLLWLALQRFAAGSLPNGFRFLDAGGGTGRWSERLLQHYDCSGVLFDLSPEMTGEAETKSAAGGFADRLSIRLGNLHEVDTVLQSEQFDLVLCFHNVLGFVQDLQGVLAGLRRLLRPGGKLVLFIPNLYHATFFNLTLNKADAATLALATNRGRFTDDMPEMHLFTPRSIDAALTKTGYRIRVSTGFPVFMYPGYEETQLVGSSHRVQALLDDTNRYEAVLKLEESVLGDEDLAPRGNNLFVVASPDESR